MKKELAILLGAALLCGGYVGYAADTVYELNPVVVTATRTPVEAFKANASVNVVTREQIEKGHYSNVQDALRDIPGVTIAGYGNTGETYSSNSLVLNGTDKIVVLIDGVRANLPGSSSTYGKMATSELSNMDSIERIEVLKSSAATLYGADAAGGVINIITRKPLDNGVQTKLSASVGSFGKEQYKLYHTGSKDGFYWELAMQKKISSDFKDGWGRTIPEHLNSETNMYKVGKRFNENADLSVTYQTYKATYLRPTSGWSTIKDNIARNAYNTGEKDNNKLNIVYKQKLGDKVENQLAFYRYVHSADDLTWKSTYSGTQTYIYHYSTLGLSDQITFRPNDKHTVVGGFEWYKDKVDHYYTSASSNYGDIGNINRAIFINDEWDLTDTWHLSYGVRYTDNSKYGDKWLPSITIGNTPTDKLNYYIGYKKFFTVPYTSQVYGTYGSPDLQPESGHAIEAGLNYRFDPTFVGSLHVFKRKMDNSIYYDQDFSKYLNTDKEDAKGFDIQLRKQFTPHFGASVAYTYTYIKPGKPSKKDGVIPNPNGDGRIPVSQWNIGLNYNNSKFSADFTARGAIGKAGAKAPTIGKVSVDGYNDRSACDRYHTYWVFDAVLNYEATKEINVYAKCNNIFNRLYTEQRYILDPEGAWYSAPGRYFEAGVEYRF